MRLLVGQLADHLGDAHRVGGVSTRVGLGDRNRTAADVHGLHERLGAVPHEQVELVAGDLDVRTTVRTDQVVVVPEGHGDLRLPAVQHQPEDLAEGQLGAERLLAGQENHVVALDPHLEVGARGPVIDAADVRDVVHHRHWEPDVLCGH